MELINKSAPGQTERVNALLEEYLRHFVSANRVQLLDVALFCYNLKKGFASNHSPFELATGQQPLTLHTNVVGYMGFSPSAYLVAKEWQEKVYIAKV